MPSAVNQAPGGCQCEADCPIVFDVTGCRSVKLQGALCSVWTSSAKTTFVGSATTNGSGAATVFVSAAGSYYAEITHSRFVTNSATFTVSSCPTGTTRTVTLSAATGYHCILNGTACAEPAADTLYFTSSLGSATLTYDAGAPGGAGWLGFIIRTYTSGCGPNCDSPPHPGGGSWIAPQDFAVLVIFRGNLALQYPSYGCTEVSFGTPNGCPVPAANTGASRFFVSGSTSGVVLSACPPALAVAGNYSWGTSFSPCGGFFSPCAIPVPDRTGTWSVTE